MKVALVHDYLNQRGGAERVLEAVHELYGGPPVYTSVFDRARMPDSYRSWDVRTSFLDRLPGARRSLRFYLPLLPTAFESFDLSGFDLVVSLSSAWAKAVVTGPDTCHASFLHTPMRFAWRTAESIGTSVARPFRLALDPMLTILRTWDVVASQRVDGFLANSRNVAARIEKIYRRESLVVHPPVDCDFFQPGGSPGDHFLVVSRLRDYKRIDRAILAAHLAGARLRIVGTGEDARRLARLAGRGVEFLGAVEDGRLRDEYRSCRALLLPGEEDFGMTALEAQACGRPVIAYGRGGALESVRPDETGLLFEEPTPESLAAAIGRSSSIDFDPGRIRSHAMEFDRRRFQERFRAGIDAIVESWRARRHGHDRR